ncbi:hypothetical protein EDB85DRAFT_1864602 [Lactarius pseudohatsudake]|nr:hypothetical protein EDB85DRAFT_1864602 [Lactarius pseudohatsudake]
MSNSVHLPVFQLPLQAVPTGFGWREHSASDRAFDTGLDQRDVFAGAQTCVICGNFSSIHHCHHIIPQAEPSTWDVLRHREWVPPTAKNNPVHKPRNGMIMCLTCHKLFDTAIYDSDNKDKQKRSVQVRSSPNQSIRDRHRKAIAIDVSNHYAPFIPLFLIHECQVCGHNPFNNSPSIPAEIFWQDWVPLHDNGTTLNCDAPRSVNSTTASKVDHRKVDLHH